MSLMDSRRQDLGHRCLDTVQVNRVAYVGGYLDSPSSGSETTTRMSGRFRKRSLTSNP